MAVFRSISAMLGAAPRRSPDRGFVLGQLVGGVSGLAAFILYALFIGWPGWAEGIAFVWLAGHAGFAILALEPERDAAAKAGALASLTLFVAYVAWELVRFFTDRFVARNGAGGHHDEDATPTTATRLATMMPLLRIALVIVISVLAVLIVLSELGVNVTPLSVHESARRPSPAAVEIPAP